MLTTLRDALRGTKIDYTTAPVGRAVIMLAVPMVVEMAMESIFAVADVFWVSHLGADAVATVGLTESMMTLIYTAAMGLSIGATALVARRIGEGRPDGAAHVAGQSVVLGLVSTKLGKLEPKDELKRKIDQAAKLVPLEQLCLSPQCGFSSTVHGNDIAVEAQAAKLRLVVETAREVWGTA